MEDWKLFERSVASFLQALEPKAKVIHDLKTPDKDTGLLRQRDVWIETSFGGLTKIVIHVSCKRWSHPVDQQDIDAFVGELSSSGAHKGVIYSFSGFTSGALKKADAKGILCCKLYQNGPVDFPAKLSFTALNSRECVRLNLMGDCSEETITLNQLIDQKIGEPQERAFDVLLTTHRDNSKTVVKGITRGPLPTWSTWIDLRTAQSKNHIRIILEGNWKVYQARIDAWLLNGSYSFSDNTYVGSFSTPAVDTQGEDPGPGWTFLGINPEVAADNIVNIVLFSGNIEDAIRANFGALRICDISNYLTN